MFKFLKDKLKSAVSKFRKKVEEEPEEVIEEPIEKEEIIKDEIKDTQPKQAEETKPEVVEEMHEPSSAPTKSEKGFFSKFIKKQKEKIIQTVSTTKISREKFDGLFQELEMALMENNVAVEIIDKIKGDLSEELVDRQIPRKNIEKTVLTSLKNSITNLFFDKKINLIDQIKNKEDKPYVIVFFGINGSGKTTTIAKVAKMLLDKKLKCVLAASDTFRAASIEQLEHHGDKLGIKVIKHEYGSDPAAVAFDAIKHAKAKNADVVLVDTAGRMHSNKNLVDEMKKIVKVAKPDLRIFVGESITGNDCVEQAKTFNEAVGIDGIILSKVDIDEKGGAAVSVSYVTKKPIIYIGVGQGYGDLREFEPKIVVEHLGLI